MYKTKITLASASVLLILVLPVINAYSDRLFVNVVNGSDSPVRYKISNSAAIKSSLPYATLRPGQERKMVLITNRPCNGVGECKTKIKIWRANHPSQSYSLGISDHASFGPAWSLGEEKTEKLDVSRSNQQNPEIYDNSTVTFIVNNRE